MATKLQVLRWQQALADERQAEIMRLIRGADRQMFLALANAEREIGRLLASLPGEGVGALVRRALYNQQRAAIVDTLNRVWGKDIVNATLGGIGTAAEILKGADAALLGVLGKGVPLGAQTLFDSLSGAMGRGIDALRSRYLNDIDLSKSVYNNVAWADGKIGSIIDAGLAAGQSAAEIAQAVRGFINPAVPGGTSFAAMRLGRTEINNAFRSLGQQTYANQPWVEGLVWNLSSSHPQDDDCDGLSEADDFDLGPGVYPAEQFPFAPHPQCFCYETAITISSEEFVNNLVDGQYDDVPLGFGQPPLTNVFGSLPLGGGAYIGKPTGFSNKAFKPGGGPALFETSNQAQAFGNSMLRGWKGTLSQDELDSIFSYTEAPVINEVLRGEQLLEAFEQELADSLDGAIQRSIIPRDTFVWRCAEKKFYDSPLGSIIDDLGYVSTSLVRDVAVDFLPGVEDGTMVRIFVPKGTFGAFVGDSDLSEFADQMEIILRRGLRFRVTGRSTIMTEFGRVPVIEISVVA